MNPKVSVIMPVYNGERYVREAVQSILNQTFKNFELIIIDDASTDKTVEILKSFTDPRIVLTLKEQNSGFTRNEGVATSKGEFVAFLDSDDIAYPTRLEKELEFLEKNPTYVLVGSSVRIIDETSSPTGVFWREKISSEKIPIRLLFGNCFALSSVMLRKKMLPRDLFDKNFIPTEDFELWTRLLQTNRGVNLPEILTDYRQHGNNLSKQKRPLQQQLINRIIEKQLRNLGVSPSEDEMNTHRTNYGFAGSIEETKQFFDKRELWLLKLLSANETEKKFDEKAFREVITERFITTLETNARVGAYAWKKFWRSPLSKNINEKELFAKLAKFFTKCLLKKDRLR